MKPTILLLPTIALAMVLGAPIQAQNGKPPKNQSEPATQVFRCAFSADPFDPCPEGAVPDGIRGDTPVPFNSVLDVVGEASLMLGIGGGRFLWLDFRNGPPRLPGARRYFDTLLLDDVWFHTNRVDTAGNEVEGGLRSLAVGQSSASRLKITFSTLSPSGEAFGWAVRFNPEGYPGSDHITVTRLSTTTWEIEATASDRAMLVSGVRRTFLSEGPFYMPFKAILTSPPPM